MRALKFITGHVIYNPAYTYKFQLKTTLYIFTPFPTNLTVFVDWMVLSGCEFRSLLTTTLTLASREPRKIQKEWCEQKNETLLKSTTQNFPP